MSTHDDDIDFDFFDEPATEEAAQRRRLPRFERPVGGGTRPPLRAPTGLTPLLRLVGLILFAIFIVVVLVLWAQSCRGAAKHDKYATYIHQATTIRDASDRIGQEVQRKLTTPGIKRDQLVSALDGYASTEDQALTDAGSMKPPGPLRLEHSHMIDSLQLRAQGLHGLSRQLAEGTTIKDATKEGELLSEQAQKLTASDVLWNVFFHDATVAELQHQNVTGVNVPRSTFFPNPELAGSTSMVRLVQGFGGASTGGKTAAGCPCGDSLESVQALPQAITLTTTQPNTVRATTNLSFKVTVKNSGNVQETQVPVTLTIGTGSSAIVKRKTITVIDAGQTTTLTFTGFVLPASMFGAKEQLKVEVAPVAGETKTQNNSATYAVFFSV